MLTLVAAIKAISRRPIFFLLAWSVLLSVVLQTNLTRALLVTDYWSSSSIVAENDDEYYYLELIRERSLRPWQFGSPYFKELDRQQYTYPQLGVSLVGMIVHLTNWRLKTVSIIFDYATVFLLVFLLSSFFYRLTSSRWYVGFGTALFFLFPHSRFLWTRPVNPQLSFILFLAVFIMVWPWVHRISAFRRILSGSLAGLMVASYPFHWTFVLPAFFLFDAWEVIKDRCLMWKDKLLTYVSFVVAAFPSFAYMISLRRLDWYEEVMRRIGLLHSRIPTGIGLQLITMVLVSIMLGVYRYWFRDQADHKKREWRFLLVWLITILGVLNQPLVTGIQLELSAHYWPVIWFVWVVVIVWLARSLIPFSLLQRSVLSRVGMGFFAAILLGQAVHAKLAVYPFFPSVQVEEQVLLKWLKNQPSTVVSAPDELVTPILLQTPHYVQFSSSAWLLLTSQAELEDRFVYHDIDNSRVEDRLLGPNRFLFGFIDEGPRHKWEAIIKKFPLAARWWSKPVPVTGERVRELVMLRKRLSASELEEGLTKYGVRLVVYPTSYTRYEALSGDVVFRSALYVVKELR